MSDGQEENVMVDDASIEEFNADETAEQQAEASPVTGTSNPAAEQTSTEKPEWDKERQRADQAEANLRKIQADRETLAARLSDAEKKLADFAKANEIDLDDPELMVEPKLVTVIKGLKSKVELLEQVKANFEATERNKALEAAREQARNEIIADIESEFPAKFRNEAIKLANDAIAKGAFGFGDNGQPLSPPNEYQAAKLLRQFYKQLASKPAASTQKPAVATDTGKKTVAAAPAESEVKEGSLREVAAQLRKKAGF